MNYTDFLNGKIIDDKNRTINDILGFNNIKLEITHDYIQRVFPTMDKSKYSDVDIIKEPDLFNLWNDENALDNVRLMYKRMLKLWKLDGDKYLNPKIFRYWVTKNNHNYLRITRVLKSLKLLDLIPEYNDFSIRIGKFMKLNENKINEETLMYWREAINKDINFC